MRNISNRLLLFSLIFVTLIACKKKEDDDTPAPKSNKTTLLTAHDWVITSVKADPPYDTIPSMNTLPNCIKDNIWTFLSNFNGSMDEGVTKCEPTDPQTPGFKWSWQNMETELRMIENLSQDTIRLQGIAIDETTFSGKTEVTEIGGVVVFATYSFKKK